MDRDFIYRQTLVWLEYIEDEQASTHAMPNVELAQSLTNHLVNNWEMVEQAKRVSNEPECGTCKGSLHRKAGHKYWQRHTDKECTIKLITDIKDYGESLTCEIKARDEVIARAEKAEGDVDDLRSALRQYQNRSGHFPSCQLTIEHPDHSLKYAAVARCEWARNALATTPKPTEEGTS